MADSAVLDLADSTLNEFFASNNFRLQHKRKQTRTNGRYPQLLDSLDVQNSISSLNRSQSTESFMRAKLDSNLNVPQKSNLLKPLHVHSMFIASVI